MTDVTTGATDTAAPVTPAATPQDAVGAPVPTPESAETPKPKNKQEARQQAFEAGKARHDNVSKEARVREAADASRERALGQPRDQGKFAKEGESAGPAADALDATRVASEGTEAAGSASVGSDEPKPATEVAGGKFVSIPVPAGHPLRDQGVTELTGIPAEQERHIRTTLNAAARSREVDEVARKNALLEARLQALSSDMPAQFESDPRLQTLLHQIEDAEGFGPDLRALVEKAFRALQNEHVGQFEQQAMSRVQMRGEAMQFKDAVLEVAPKMLKVWAESGELDNRLIGGAGRQGLLAEYGYAIDQYNENLKPGQQPLRPDPKHFFGWVGKTYTTDPRVKAQMERLSAAEKERERQRIADEVRAEFASEREAKAAEAQRRHGSRPPLGQAASTSAPPNLESDDASRQAMQQPNRKRALRELAKQAGERYSR